MRPLELRLRNFRSYFGDAFTFDFRDRRLIGIVGPIGSGKSTLLDAIAFALYGRTPRIARSTRSLIHQRADSAAVSLRFEVDGDVWEAVRSLRARGPSQHALYRYETDEPDVEPVEKVVQEAEVNARIAALLGFDFDAFGRSVLLAQGQFAEFLTARPAERDKVLKGVFGHERIDSMRELAKSRIRAGEFEVDKLQLRLEQAEQAIVRLAQRRTELTEAEQRLAAIEKHEARVRELTELATTAGRAATAAGDRLRELERHATRMPDPEDTHTLLGRAMAAREERSRLASQLAVAHSEMVSAEDRLRSDPHAADTETLTKLDAALAERAVRSREVELAEQHHQKAEARRKAAVGEADEAGERAAREAATRDHAESVRAAAWAEAQASEAAVHAATHAEMAAALRSGLAAGDPCPVCAQPVPEPAEASPVTDVPDIRAAAEAAQNRLRAADQQLATATADLAAATRAISDTNRRVEEITVELTGSAVAQAEAVQALAEVDARIVDLVGPGDAAGLRIALADEIARLETAAEHARRAWDDVRRRHDGAIAAEQETDRALGDLRTRLGALAALLNADADPPEDDPAALEAALREVREGWAAETIRLAADVERANATTAEADRELKEVFAELGVKTTFDAAKAEAETAVGMLAEAIQADEKLVADSEDLLDARQRAVDDVERFRRIAGDLTDARFIRYLLDEERAGLAELGSDHFQRLSSGRYRFTDDGSFEVVDLTSADSVRKADSLSGGETFLASLGLALGLAEMVSRTGGRLDAFFLDEGFGSLDPEHLDLAMDGIEQLVADGTNRLVVVVSHVAEMCQRMEDLIVLDRDPTTGDSVVMAGATG